MMVPIISVYYYHNILQSRGYYISETEVGVVTDLKLIHCSSMEAGRGGVWMWCPGQRLHFAIDGHINR